MIMNVTTHSRLTSFQNDSSHSHKIHKLHTSRTWNTEPEATPTLCNSAHSLWRSWCLQVCCGHRFSVLRGMCRNAWRGHNRGGHEGVRTGKRSFLWCSVAPNNLPDLGALVRAALRLWHRHCASGGGGLGHQRGGLKEIYIIKWQQSSAHTYIHTQTKGDKKGIISLENTHRHTHTHMHVCMHTTHTVTMWCLLIPNGLTHRLTFFICLTHRLTFFMWVQNQREWEQSYDLEAKSTSAAELLIVLTCKSL